MLRVYVDADVLFRAATASHQSTAALVLLRMAEFTLLDVISATYTVDEAAAALSRYLPDQVAALLRLVAVCVRVTDEPPPALLHAYREQAHWKDVINLAAAVHGKASVLVSYNTRHYYPQTKIVQVMTPGDLVTKARSALSNALA